MSRHGLNKDSSKPMLLALGLGSMGGELAVSQRIVPLLSNYFEVSEEKISAQPIGWQLPELLIKIKKAWGTLGKYHNQYSYLYTTESFVVFIAMIRFAFVDHSLKPVFIYHFHGTKATPYSAYFFNHLRIILAKVDHFFHRSILKKIEKLAIIKSDYVIVPDQLTGTELKAIRNKETFVLPSYVDVDLFQPARSKIKAISNKSSFVVGFIGRISKEKGVFELIKAGLYLKDEITFVITHVPGINDHLFEEIVIFAQKNHLKLKCYKKLNQVEVSALIKQLDCVVLPSQSEHLPLAMLESLATGVPCFATNVGDCGLILNQVDPGLVLNEGTAKSIAHKLLWWQKTNDSYQQKIRRKCRQVALNYSTENFDQKVEDIFTKVLSKS